MDKFGRFFQFRKGGQEIPALRKMGMIYLKHHGVIALQNKGALVIHLLINNCAAKFFKTVNNFRNLAFFIFLIANREEGVIFIKETIGL